jgi:hypothetical protein
MAMRSCNTLAMQRRWGGVGSDKIKVMNVDLKGRISQIMEGVADAARDPAKG